jgi:predicted AlkP superfamily phosphohydrolase/phosphomutase
MMTGKNLGKLGFTDFVLRRPHSYRINLINPDWDKLMPIWKIASNAGKLVYIHNVPTAKVPSQELNGIFIAGNSPMGALVRYGREALFAHPAWLQEELAQRGYEIDYGVNYASGGSYFDKVMQITREKMKLAIELLQKKKFDLAIFCLLSTDSLAHAFWGRKELATVYEEIDNFLASVLDIFNEDLNIFIVSDHGQTYYKKHVDLNAWLNKNGFMHLKYHSGHAFNRMSVFHLFRWLHLVSVYRKLTTSGRLAKIDRELKKLIPLTKFSSEDIDWQATKAYSVGANSLFINLKGREPDGIVTMADFENVRGAIMRALSSWFDPETGEAIVNRVWKKEDLYSGNLVDKLPDIFIEFNHGFGSSGGEPAPIAEPLSQPPPWVFSTHTMDGIFIAHGPDIEAGGKSPASFDILDVAPPTALHALGLPIPSSMDGKVNTGIFKSSSEPGRRKPDYTDSSADEDRNQDSEYVSSFEDNEVYTRLKHLGYVD